MPGRPPVRVAGVRENVQNSAHPYADDFVAQTFTGAHQFRHRAPSELRAASSGRS
jgi:hypothetical protein